MAIDYEKLCFLLNPKNRPNHVSNNVFQTAVYNDDDDDHLDWFFSLAVEKGELQGHVLASVWVGRVGYGGVQRWMFAGGIALLQAVFVLETHVGAQGINSRKFGLRDKKWL